MSNRSKKAPKLTSADYVCDLPWDGSARPQRRAPAEPLKAQALSPATQALLEPQPALQRPKVSGSAHVRWRKAEKGARPTAPRAPDARLRCAEVSGLEAGHLLALPAPVTLLCEACVRAGTAAVVVVTTSKADYAAARSRRLVTLHGAEWEALALAAVTGRVTAVAFEHWLATKQVDPSWELTLAVTLGCYVRQVPDAPALSVEEVLRACGARLMNVSDSAVASGGFWQEETYDRSER